VTVKYKILFLVEVLHDYYRNLQCNDFNIIPSAATVQLLKDHQALYKMAGNKFLVLIKTGNDGKPVSPIEPFAKLRFYLDLINPNFISVTRFETGSPAQRLYFNNLAGNKPAGYAYLTEPLPAHDPSFVYNKTDLAVNDSEVFECIKVPSIGIETDNEEFWVWRNRIVEFNAGTNYSEGDIVVDNGIVFIRRKDGPSGRPTSDTVYWQLRGFQGLAQYVTEKNGIELSPFLREFKLTAASTEFEIKVFGLNIVNNQYDSEVLGGKMTTETDTDKIKIDLRELHPKEYTGLRPGRYVVRINSDNFNLYIDDEAYFQNAFGIIEIFNHLPDGDDFALLDDEGKIKVTGATDEPPGLNYTIRFANRMAYWKYLTPAHGIDAVNTDGVYHFQQKPPGPARPNFFMSVKPIPLTEMARRFTLSLHGEDNGRQILVPNPDPSVTGILTKEAGNDYYCTMNLNY
jgi:hypothetical protein